MVSYTTDSNREELRTALSTRGEFVAMKTLSGRGASQCDKHLFGDKMTMSTLTIFEISLLSIVVLTRKKNEKNGTFATTHCCV